MQQIAALFHFCSGGLLDVDIQAAKQWRHGNLTEEPDFSWSPIFQLKSEFCLLNLIISNVSSISQESCRSFSREFYHKSTTYPI